jgi:large subunit ribosomal protein L22
MAPQTQERVTEAKAILKYARISQSKVEIVLALIRNKKIDLAFAILKNTPKAASPLLLKLLKSAVANAENNYAMDTGKLVVARAVTGAGPTMKRIMPRGKGRAYRVKKRTSHVTLVVKEA